MKGGNHFERNSKIFIFSQFSSFFGHFWSKFEKRRKKKFWDLNSNVSIFTSFCPFKTLIRSKFQKLSELFEYRKKNYILCLFPTKKCKNRKKLDFWNLKQTNYRYFHGKQTNKIFFLKKINPPNFCLTKREGLSRKSFLTILEPRQACGYTRLFIKSLKIFHF